MAADLHEMLTGAGFEPPYILAGHSLGGIIARRFISQYPGTVRGLLLIDSSHEDQARQFRKDGWWGGGLSNLRRALQRQFRILGARRLAVTLGLLRHFDAEIAREAPPEFAGAARAITLSTRHRRMAVWELLTLARSQGQPPDLGSLPLTVLTSANHSWRGWTTWTRLQAELAGLSADNCHINAREAGHYVHLDEPALVVRVIRDLLARCTVG